MLNKSKVIQEEKSFLHQLNLEKISMIRESRDKVKKKQLN